MADIPAPRAIDYFVKAPFHSGMRMLLYRIAPHPAPETAAP